MTTLDPRALEAAAEAVGRHIHYSRQSHNCHRCRRTAESAITAYLAVTQPIVEELEGLEELPVGTIILDRFEDESYTRIVGPRWVSWVEQDGLRHTEVALPARVLWRPQS
ncbi:hypothetical protein [Micrococcus terreus]|uniref:hypothetical protein n=1 Tax=Micrococcus terreus TaxID=574650 RepID=UPI003D747034